MIEKTMDEHGDIYEDADMKLQDCPTALEKSY